MNAQFNSHHKEDILLVGPSDTLPTLYIRDWGQLSEKDISALSSADFLRWPPILLLVDLNYLDEQGFHLHPRVETLLHYNDRPQNIHLPDPDKLVFRWVKFEPLADILDDWGATLCLESTFHDASELFTALEALKLESKVQLIHDWHFRGSMEPSVSTSYNKKGQLKFLNT